MISGHATVQIAVEAIRLGAYEFIEKPFSKEKILNYVNRALESSLLKKEKDFIENKLFHSFDLIGDSPNIVKVKKTDVAIIMVEQNAKQALSISDRGYVLVTGENKFEGSGKELLNDPEVRRSFLGA